MYYLWKRFNTPQSYSYPLDVTEKFESQIKRQKGCPHTHTEYQVSYFVSFIVMVPVNPELDQNRKLQNRHVDRINSSVQWYLSIPVDKAQVNQGGCEIGSGP